MTMSAYEGPFDKVPWPETLKARVIDPGNGRPRLHGYDVRGDLAQSCSWVECTLLALTGELPSPAAARAFEAAATFLLPVPVNQAPTHAATIARICEGSTSAIVGTAAIALAEQARFVVAEHRALLEWLDAGGTFPAAHRARDAAEDESVMLLERASGSQHAIFSQRPSLTSACLALLHACGLKSAERMEATLVTIRLPAVLAEALATKPATFREYPVNLPEFEYAE